MPIRSNPSFSSLTYFQCYFDYEHIANKTHYLKTKLNNYHFSVMTLNRKFKEDTVRTLIEIIFLLKQQFGLIGSI